MHTEGQESLLPPSFALSNETKTRVCVCVCVCVCQVHLAQANETKAVGKDPWDAPNFFASVPSLVRKDARGAATLL